jgi:hypothetical protein
MTEHQADITPNQGTGQAGASAQINSIANRIANKLAEAKGGTENAQGEVETPEEITADFGGTPRKFKVADLTAAYAKQEETRQLEAAIEKKLKMLGNVDGYKALTAQLEAMTPAQRQKLQQVFQNPALLDDAGDDEDDSMDSVIDNALNGKDRKVQPSKMDPQFASEFAQVKQAVQALASMAQQNMQERQQQTLDQQLTAAMSAFPVFQPRTGDKKQQAALGYMRKSILNQYTASPDSGLDTIVAEAARVMQGMTEAAANGVLAEVTGSSGISPPEKKFTGADLRSGKIGEAAGKILSALARRA